MKNNDLLTIETYKVCVTEARDSHFYLGLVEHGIVTDFIPTKAQEEALLTFSKPLNLATLFSVEERQNNSLGYLLSKQLLHYVEVYGLNEPGLFGLECGDGEKVTFNFIHGVTTSELKDIVQKQLYSNRPIKNIDAVKYIIRDFDIPYDINQIANNEIKIALFNPITDRFTDGDDVVRYIVYLCTGKTLLIKSREVLAAVQSGSAAIPVSFFEDHQKELSAVFNRHKKIILSCKNRSTSAIINHISRMSKKTHVPIRESVTKTFIADFISGKIKHDDLHSVLKNTSTRDKFKYLNLIEFKKSECKYNAYIVRNGKIFAKARTDTNSESIHKYNVLEEAIILYLRIIDLNHLYDKNIILDENIDYGLPVSAKQTLGNLPFGTTFEWYEDRVSVGIHWRDEWGARDLDLSSIDHKGNRLGWGYSSAYNDKDIVFSGDVTSARNGAMEFFTTKNDTEFGLLVNIFSGEPGCGCEVVVGTQGNNSKRWIDNVIIREKTKLDSNGMILGFVNKGKFVVYQGRLNNKIANFTDGSNPVLEKNKSSMLTVESIFDKLGIEYDYNPKKDTKYDYDLRYKGFTIDKLEDMLLTK